MENGLNLSQDRLEWYEPVRMVLSDVLNMSEPFDTNH